MHRRSLVGILFLILLMSVSGCGPAEVDSQSPTGGNKVSNQEKNISFQVLDELSLPPALQEKSRTLREQEKAGTEIVHDGKNTFILIVIGPRNTAGYAIEVKQVVQKGETVTIQAREITPAPDSFTAQVITYPLVGVQIPHDPTITNVQIEWQ